MMDPTLVVDPGFRFEQIAATLADLDWVRQADTAVTQSILPGEPEFAAWRRPNGGRLSYTFNPVVHLRVLVFKGEDAPRLCEEARKRVPALDVTGVRRLLESGDARAILLGIFAAVELNLLGLANELDGLRTHAEPAVAKAANQACARLGRRLLEIGARRLAEEQAARPDRLAIFPRLGDAERRRQILRWLMHDHKTANPEIVRTLRAALEDRDWEVRATAMLAAARLGVTELWREVREMHIPATTREGPDRTDRSILLAFRRAALDRLGAGRQASEDHLYRCMMGEAVVRHDRAFLLAHALTEPLPAQSAPPAVFRGIEQHEGEVHLRGSNLALCWVAAAPHWLGADEALPSPNPVRLVAPPSGFFVSRAPALAVCSWLEAREFCSKLSREAMVQVRLPSAEEWEMAVRGPDGRRFPWGNGFEGDPVNKTTPWGLKKVCSGEPVWVDQDGVAVWGERNDYRCAARRSSSSREPDLRCRVYAVVRPD